MISINNLSKTVLSCLLGKDFEINRFNSVEVYKFMKLFAILVICCISQGFSVYKMLFSAHSAKSFFCKFECQDFI
jgi:hypothetical protein